MLYTKASQGRCFILRLEDGELIQDTIEKFAASENIKRAYIQVVGAGDKGSILITGPEKSRSHNFIPMHAILNEMHEVFGFGTLFPGNDGIPKLHMHLACGREENTITGEIRNGVKVWNALEALVIELLDNDSIREYDKKTGVDSLLPG